MSKIFCLACEKLFEDYSDTLFDKITQSPEALAEKLVYYLRMGDIFTSEIIDTPHRTREEAIAATVAKLKEVCDD